MGRRYQTILLRIRCSRIAQRYALTCSQIANDHQNISAGIARHRSLHFRVRGPAQAARDSAAVILTLDGKLLAALVEAKHLIVKIQHGDDEVNTMAMRQAVAHLRVYLRVRIVVYVAVGTFYSAGCAVLTVVKENIPVIVRWNNSCLN